MNDESPSSPPSLEFALLTPTYEFPMDKVSIVLGQGQFDLICSSHMDLGVMPITPP